MLFKNRHLAGVQFSDFGIIAICANHFVANGGQASARNESDISAADY
jgi:hypothetical protein